MENYNPKKSVNSEEWLELDEDERLMLVEKYHEQLDLNLEPAGLRMHCVLHVTVETQLAEGEIPVIPKTLARLRRQGLDRHEAIHAIASTFSQGLFDTMQGSGKEFSIKNYRLKLEKLTAKKWLKS